MMFAHKKCAKKIEKSKTRRECSSEKILVNKVPPKTAAIAPDRMYDGENDNGGRVDLRIREKESKSKPKMKEKHSSLDDSGSSEGRFRSLPDYTRMRTDYARCKSHSHKLNLPLVSHGRIELLCS